MCRLPQPQIKVSVGLLRLVHEVGLCRLCFVPHNASALFTFVALVLAGSQTRLTPCVQAEEVKRAADQVAQLRRVGKGLGVFEFDRSLAASVGRLSSPVAIFVCRREHFQTEKLSRIIQTTELPVASHDLSSSVPSSLFGCVLAPAQCCQSSAHYRTSLPRQNGRLLANHSNGVQVHCVHDLR